MHIERSNEENSGADAALLALRALGGQETGLTRTQPDEIWVRARVDEILGGGRRHGRRQRILAAAQALAFDAAIALLAWSMLDAVPVVPFFGFALSKALVVALVTAAAHVTVSWSWGLSNAQL